MSAQPITAELRRWIVAQATAGHPPDVVLDAMKASGWDEDVAIDALETTMRSPPRRGRRRRAGRRPPASEPARPVPRRRASTAGTPSIRAGDRDVRVVMAMQLPRVVVFADLLSDDECDELIALARSRLARSETVETSTGASAVNPARTSDGMFFERGEFPVCARLEQRIAALLDWPLENGEGLQILRYGPGTEYLPHYDYFDPAEPGTPAILKRGGQRVASLVCYLNTPERRRRDRLPRRRPRSRAGQGQRASSSATTAPHPSTRTLHGGAPVTAGEKWVATKWLREGKFE